MDIEHRVSPVPGRAATRLVERQSPDGRWRFVTEPHEPHELHEPLGADGAHGSPIETVRTVVTRPRGGPA